MSALWLSSIRRDSVGRNAVREFGLGRRSVRVFGCPPFVIIWYLEGARVRGNCPRKNFENCMRNIVHWEFCKADYVHGDISKVR